MEDLLRTWFTTSQQGVAFAEPVRNPQGEIIDFRYQLVNQSFARVLGTEEENLTGNLLSAHPVLPGTDWLSPLIRVVETGRPHQWSEQTDRPDRALWLQLTVTQLAGQVLITIQDVTVEKQAEQELQRRLAMESIVSTVASRLIRLEAGEVDAYLIDALSRLAGYNGADRASIFRYSPDHRLGSCTHEWCASGVASISDHFQDVPVGVLGLIHERLEEGNVIRLQADQLPPEATREKALFELIAIRSMMAVPLVLDGETVGFIGFFAIRQAQTWDENDISLLQTFSTLIVHAQQRRQQEAAIQRANQRLEGLHTIDQALLSPRSAGQSPLLTALRHINALVPCERLTIFQIGEASGLATAVYRLAEGELEVNPGIVFSARYFTDQFELNGPLTYLPELESGMSILPPDLNLYERGFRSLLVLPLYVRQECIGAFTLVSVVPHFFTKEYREIAVEVASQLAIVLHQQQLDEQVRQYTEQLEQRVEERTLEVRGLSRIHQAILKYAGQAIISTDTHGRVQTANPASEKLLGYRAEELIGRVAQVTPGSADQPIPFIAYQPFLSSEPPSDSFMSEMTAQGYFSSECIAIGKDGRQVPILLVSSTLQDEDGMVIGYVGIATDISALKTAEAGLQQKNQELNTFFEGALDLHCIASLRGRILKVNRAWETTMGYSPDELTSMGLLALLHPDERSAILQTLQDVIPHRPVQNQLNHFRRKDGTYRAVEWNAIRIENRIYASARDITERRQAEEQLRNLNQRLQLATRAAGQGIWEDDLVKGQLIWDDRLWELHGLPPGRTDWSFQEYLKIIHPDDLPAFRAYSHEGPAVNNIKGVARIIRPDGEIRYIETQGLVVRNRKKVPIRSIGVAWDVTERKLAEAALRESEERFREIAENVDEVFWIHSVEPFELLYINSAYERVFGIDPAQVNTGSTAFLDTILEEDHAMVMTEFEKYRQGQEVTVQCRVKGTHKEIRWIQIRTFVIKDSQGSPQRYIGIVNDITSQKEKELVLQQSLQREQELNQLKSQFVSTASHEFRTPLTTIQSSVDLIRLYLDLPPTTALPPIRNHLTVIEKEIDKFSALLTDMLTIGRIEAGKVSFNPRWMDLVTVCEEVITTHFSQRNDNRSVRLTVQGIPYSLYLDDKLMGHVVVNLLSNAFKFSKTDPRLHLEFGEKSLVLRVVDEGIGIPAADLSRLFQAFFRAGNTAGIQGTGLGLAIARQFVELHGGQLEVQSEENKGTAFTITLPAPSPEQRLPA